MRRINATTRFSRVKRACLYGDAQFFESKISRDVILYVWFKRGKKLPVDELYYIILYSPHYDYYDLNILFNFFFFVSKTDKEY